MMLRESNWLLKAYRKYLYAYLAYNISVNEPSFMILSRLAIKGVC